MSSCYIDLNPMELGSFVTIKKERKILRNALSVGKWELRTVTLDDIIASIKN